MFLPACPSSQSPSRSSGNEWSLLELDVLLLAGTVAHTISLAASSFVEEEHQIWYFLLSTLCLAVFQDVCRKYFREQKVSGDDEDTLLPSKGSHPSAHPKGEIYSEKWLALATPIFTLVCCRLLRSLNQTGVQWAHLPDVGHWLNRLSLPLILIHIMINTVQAKITYIVKKSWIKSYMNVREMKKKKSVLKKVFWIFVFSCGNFYFVMYFFFSNDCAWFDTDILQVTHNVTFMIAVLSPLPASCLSHNDMPWAF